MKEILKKITHSKELEAKWLNTVSLLEFIGASKISKTMCQKNHPNLDVLEHLADETRHAYAFKKMSQMVCDKFDSEYLCKKEAIAYFQTLDQMLSNKIETIAGENNTELNYLVVTNAIERRAMKLYPLYKSLTQNEYVREELQKIILEETNHMHPIEEKVISFLNQNGVEDFSEFQKIEEDLFEKFSHQVQASLEKHVDAIL